MIFGGDWLGRVTVRQRESVALIDQNLPAPTCDSVGRDRVRYLNAILTNNIKDLATGNGNRFRCF